MADTFPQKPVPGRWIGFHVLAAVPDGLDPAAVRERMLDALADAAPTFVSATYIDENGQAMMRETRSPGRRSTDG